jgi:hypothetical protein
MTRSLLVSLLFVAAPGFADADLVAQGESSWAERSTGFASLGAVSPLPVQRAIAAWEAALTEAPNDVELRFRLVEALYFWGHFAAPDQETSRRAADRQLALAEETYELVIAPLGASGTREATVAEQAGLERPLVHAPAAHFWCAISWGVWGMAHGRLASARRDVASRIRRHAEVLIELDPRYADAGGLRLLGRLHTATPRVPFVTGWIDRREGIELLRRAHATSTRDARNALFLAEALLEHAPDRRAEAIALLREVAARSPAPESVVEETETIDAACRRLAAETRP